MALLQSIEDKEFAANVKSLRKEVSQLKESIELLKDVVICLSRKLDELEKRQ